MSNLKLKTVSDKMLKSLYSKTYAVTDIELGRRVIDEMVRRWGATYAQYEMSDLQTENDEGQSDDEHD